MSKLESKSVALASMAAVLCVACVYAEPSATFAPSAVDFQVLDVRLKYSREANGDRVALRVDNPTDRAICIPDYLTFRSKAKYRSLDFLRVVDLASGDVLETLRRRLHEPDVIDAFVMVPPRGTNVTSDRLIDFFALEKGNDYKIQYRHYAFFCDAFNGGYPPKIRSNTEAYERDELPYFEQDSGNMVLLQGEAVFTKPIK